MLIGLLGTDHFLVTLLDRLSNEWPQRPPADVPGKTTSPGVLCRAYSI